MILWINSHLWAPTTYTVPNVSGLQQGRTKVYSFLQHLEKKVVLIKMKIVTGQKPGKNTYVCQKCGQTVTLYDHTDIRPPCPDCHGTIFHCYEVQNKSQYETGYTFLPDYHN